ncbi:bifunctional diguanylate cyclase/phosphodiesterase [Legionella sp. km772]|uniref:putative bifunctional diguanylate cyclase/phosphodiesterase n=1 Tax=Legionella sp. km772 TaxID=2498111 RepID=UPI000F8C5A28|nr:EAL domain-containing protein [Legionella sp. km772]RUR12706.1 EAL domain-containing protein [Legionella sp. km772]
MLDKKTKITAPLNLSSLRVEELNKHLSEQDLLRAFLELSRQEPDEALLKNKLFFLLNQHGLLKNKKMALWQVDKKNNFSFIASQHIDDNLKKHLSSRICYEDNSATFLHARAAPHSLNPELVPIDVYLERTSQSLLGISFWFENEDLIHKLHTPFFKDLFTLVNLIIVKAFYKRSLNKDIERQKRDYEALLRHQARYDSLTDLPNRFHGFAQLEQAIGSAQAQDKKLAILFLDLDEFKQINDAMGHIVGDLLLKILAKRYLTLMRPVDTLVRLGGDEFMIILGEFVEQTYPEELAQKCQEQCLRPFKLEEEEFFISSSIGIALYPEHGDDAKTLMCHADAAMYQSKMRGRNNWTVFINNMMDAASHRMRIKTELYQVLNRDELELYYQPIIDMVEQKVFSVEALLRWHSSTLGIVSPEQIISLAEETGLIVPLGYWVLSKVCADLKKWQRIRPEQIKIAVNISIIQLKQDDFIEQVQAILKQREVHPEALIFEITESAFIDDSLLILERLNRLNQMGIECSLDDFGMGYSSLNYLRSYPFKSLKIDRVFIQGIDSNENDLNLVHGMVSMAKNLRLSVIAEGIENNRQLELLMKMGCDMAQGWYFAKALHFKDLVLFFNKAVNFNK